MTRALCLIVLLVLAAAGRAAEPPVTLARIESPNRLMLFPPNEQAAIRYHLRNATGQEQRITCAFRLMDWGGRTLARRESRAAVPANGEASVPFALDTKSFRLGIYRLVFRMETPGSPAFERESYLGIASRTKLRKAKDGEFLYGLDVQLGDPPPDSPLYLWMEAMGVDIVRCGYDWDVHPDYVQRQQAVFAAHHLRALSMFDPPKTQDTAERKAQLERKCAGLEEVARAHPAMVYYELGNEPDLDFFYPGPIENYAEDFAAMSRAIHQGNPKAVVMNGGLCYVGEKGRDRARRFVQVADPAALDMFAYHGHGPGAKAERAAYENTRRTAREFGKGDKPLVETESGVAARTPDQEIMQARTAVQKLVFAQSVRMPFFIWFRLLMFEEDYGNLKDREALEPRPAVLAYRATVEALRGYRFVKVLDTGVPDGEAYLFQQAGGKGRACVLWTDRPVTRTVSLALGARPSGVRRRDIFGNAAPVVLRPGGTVQVDASEDPVFLTWDSPSGTEAVRVAEPPVHAPHVAQLVEGAENTFTMAVRNPSARPAALEVRLAPEPGVPVAVTPTSRRVTLPVRGSRTLAFTLRAGEAVPGLRWPRAWTVFRSADLAADALARLTGIPASLPGAGGPVPAERVIPAGGVIDLVVPGRALTERAPAVVMAEVESDAERTTAMGASADWWMAWAVNGKPIFDTLADGNGAISGPMDHVFDLPLKRGRNLLAARVLSGSQGFKLLVADPATVARARSGAAGSALVLTATEAGKVVSRQVIEVQETAPIPPLGDLAFDAPLSAWEAREPSAILAAESVHNEFAKQPDPALWWKGDADLSATLWLRYDARRLYLVAKVRDDRDVTGADPAAMWRNDSLQLAFARPGAADYSEVAVGRVGDRVTVYRHAPAESASPAGFRAAVERAEPGVTVYRLAVDRAMLDGAEFLLNVLVNDDDGAGRKQFAEWTPGLGEAKDPTAWHHVVLPARGNGRRL